MKTYRLSDDVFGLCLTVFTDCTIGEVQKKYHLPKWILSEWARARFFEIGTTHNIRLGEKKVSTFTHELLHFLWCALEKRGIAFSYEDEKDETYCYLLEYFLKQALKKIKLKCE